MRLPPSSPVLARPSAEGVSLQVGLARPVVLTGLGAPERAFVASLEGGRPVSAPEARRFARVISILAAAGAWEGEPLSPRAVAAVVHGAGALGMEIAAGLARTGLDVSVADAAPIGVEPEGTYPPAASGTCGGAAAASLAARGVRVRVGSAGERLGVEVCFGVPDPVQTAAWMRDDIPHVLVVCDEETVWVSHVIVPGTTACGRCRDLQLAAADSAWPQLALQLGGAPLASRRPFATAVATIAVGARVTHRIARWRELGDSGTAERIGADGSIATEVCVAERECGCGAFGPAGDEVAARRAAWPAATR